MRIDAFVVWRTHQGDLMGFAPTGSNVTITGIDIHRIEDGRIADLWHEVDTMGLLQQIGALPSQ